MSVCESVYVRVCVRVRFLLLFQTVLYLIVLFCFCFGGHCSLLAACEYYCYTKIFAFLFISAEISQIKKKKKSEKIPLHILIIL